MVTAAQARRAPQPPIVVGALKVEPKTREASFHTRPLPLTPTEFDLLVCLARDCGRVLTREQLLLEVADRDFESFDRSIDVHISLLRCKLGDDPKKPLMILTARSAGYMLREPGGEAE